MENYFLYILGALFISQFFAPALAGKIKSRFIALDQKMESSTLGSILNITSFWREASNINGKLNDKMVTKYLYILFMVGYNYNYFYWIHCICQLALKMYNVTRGLVNSTVMFQISEIKEVRFA